MRRTIPHRRPRNEIELQRSLESVIGLLERALLEKADGDVEMLTPGAGIVLVSPDGNTRARVSIDNAGAVIATTL